MQSRVHHPVHEAVAEALGRRLGRVVEPVLHGDWRVLQRHLARGRVQLGTLCSPYVLAELGRADPRWEVLAGLVPRGTGGRPEYRSSLMVREDSPWVEPADLAGTRLGFNEPFSLSGYHCVRLWVAELGQRRDFFSSMVETGGHRANLRALAAGEVDVVALDSTVEAWHRRHRPARLEGLRRVVELGPFPHPPLVAHRDLGPEVMGLLREAMRGLPEDPALRARLDAYDFEGLLAYERGVLEALGERLAAIADVRLAPRRRDLRGI